jgi:hypothetical protein
MITLSNVIIIVLFAGGIAWIYSAGEKQKNIEMVCHVGLTSEFKDCFTRTQQFCIYEGKCNGIFGVSHLLLGKAWIFIDRIVLYGALYNCDVIEEITNTTIHELIHLCGILDEDMTCLGVELVK